jgi:hypothetical protein
MIHLANPAPVPSLVFAPAPMIAPQVYARRDGATLAELVASVPAIRDNPALARHIVVEINGEAVPADLWPRLRPKGGTPQKPVMITLRLVQLGGRGGKQFLAIFASIALLLTGAWIAGGGLSGLLGSAFAAGTFGAQASAAAVTLVGSLAIRALTPPPSRSTLDGATPDRAEAFAQGNIIEPGGAIPRIVGERRVYPPFATNGAIIDYVGEDNYAEAVYVLAGPHRLTDIRVDDAPVTSLADVEVETREGFASDTPLTLVTRYGATDNAGVALSDHKLKDAPNQELQDQATPANSCPQWHIVTSRKGPDEIWLHITWGAGLGDTDNATVTYCQPLRLRMRPVGGSTWVELPTILFAQRRAGPVRRHIKLIFGNPPGSLPTPPTDNGAVRAYLGLPGQAVTPTGAGAYTVDPTFTATPRVALEPAGATIWLAASAFAAGQRWEIASKLGLMVVLSNLNTSYQLSGTVRDLFGYYDNGIGQFVVIRNRVNNLDRAEITRVQSIWNDSPLAGTGLAAIALRVKNRGVSRLGVTAGAYVPDWNGTAWAGNHVTTNPAPHLRAALTGAENAEPVPADLIDNASLVAWRSHCATEGYAVNAIMDGRSLDDAVRIITGCGYARLRRSETYGVVMDRDRAAEPIVQLFGPRNAAAITMEKAFPQRPHGLRVRYRDAGDLDRETEILVIDPDYSGTASRFEQVGYEGFISEAESEARALFDLKQARLRSATWSWQSDVESLACEPGSLVGLSHDMIEQASAVAHIKSVTRNGSNQITSIVLDDRVPVDDGTAPYTVAVIRLPDLSSVTARIAADATSPDDTLVMHTPFVNAAVAAGCLVAVGPVSTVLRRLIITNITPGADLTARIEAVDEAPELWA